MAISREKYDKKAPTQNPVDFFKGETQGGTDGKAQKIPDKLSGGPVREKIYGRDDLSKQ